MREQYIVYVWDKSGNTVIRKEYFWNEDCAWAFHDAEKARGKRVEFKVQDIRMAS